MIRHAMAVGGWQATTLQIQRPILAAHIFPIAIQWIMRHQSAKRIHLLVLIEKQPCLSLAQGSVEQPHTANTATEGPVCPVMPQTDYSIMNIQWC